jgi:catechol 2,3-dioxygenase-like lactoylglutathione lyase family enzyme
MPPTLANGKICYIELPATDIARSSDFYKRIFGWNIRARGDGSTSFDDTTGQVSGTWVLGRPRQSLGFFSTSWSTVWPRLLKPSPPMGVKSSSRSGRTRPRSLRDFAIREET